MGRTPVDLAGRRFGRLTAVAPTEKRRSSSVVWRCRCDCGREVEVTANNLMGRGTRSCGCLRLKDIAGRRFGKLTALEPTDKRVPGQGGAIWLCRCDCGAICEASENKLAHGQVRSCGCLRKGKQGRRPEAKAREDDVR